MATILIIVVAIVWTFIFIRIKTTFFSKSQIKSTKTIQYKTIEKEVENKDTFSLVVSYDDPFLKAVAKTQLTQRSKESQESQIIKKPINQVKSQIKPNNCVWADIKYGGLLQNSDNNKQTALLRINGKSYRLKKDEYVKEYTIDQLYKDSIILKKDNCFKTFYKAR